MEKLVQIAKAFSDTNRILIVALILRDKEVCVCEICDTLELSQPLVSRHLKQLKEAHIVQSHKEGKWQIYTAVDTTDNPLLHAWFDTCREQAGSLPLTCSCKRE